MRNAVLVITVLVFGFNSFAQIRKTPAAVTQAFEKQYPNASGVQYEDNLINVQVHFASDSGKMIAKYNGDGTWKETEREFNYDDLPADVKVGFDKSKYATDWKVKETAIIYLPNNDMRYRVKVEKNDLQKKYLFFDKNGRLIKDSLTI
ncbi:MAG TPA: PepSY-like domain-containing protein [Flavisolibacter sp.]|nr:PepSY-like domain-containing protein [Flavisolibacter sp.]